MKTRVLVNGAKGKMGILACETLSDHPDFELVASLGREDNLAEAIISSKARIVVDLTRADCVFHNANIIIQAGAHPVIGTSGLTPLEIQTLTEMCLAKKLGGLIVPNFSIGAVLMMIFAAKAAKYLPHVEIIEAHHQYKVDAPSGTALKTADMIHEARMHDKKISNLKEVIPGARGAMHCDIPIHSIRLPGVLARQEVLFGNLGETLSLTHNTIDRHCFMPGVILSCQKVLELDQLIYGLEKILEP